MEKIMLYGVKVRVTNFPSFERMIEISVMCSSTQISLDSKQNIKVKAKKL